MKQSPLCHDFCSKNTQRLTYKDEIGGGNTPCLLSILWPLSLINSEPPRLVSYKFISCLCEANLLAGEWEGGLKEAPPSSVPPSTMTTGSLESEGSAAAGGQA